MSFKISLPSTYSAVHADPVNSTKLLSLDGEKNVRIDFARRIDRI